MGNGILTLSVNPSIDRTLVVENFITADLNRVINSRVDIGGKGVNVARNLKNLRDKVTITGFIGRNAFWMIDFLNKEGIINDFVKISKDTRINIKIFDAVKKELTELNERGPEVVQDDIKSLKEKVATYATSSDVVVLTGSLPPGMLKTFYGNMIRELKHMNVKVILDADGEALLHGIDEKPFMIKPNINELENLRGKKFGKTDQLIEEAKKLNQFGIKIVAVTMGSNGSIIVTDSEIFIVEPIKVNVKSSVGAGDAFVAGFAHGIYQKLSIDETIKIAVAMSTAVVMKEGTSVASLKDVEKLKDKVKFQRIKR